MESQAGGYLLVVEDNPDDEALTLRALQKNHIDIEVCVVRDGQEALDFLFPDEATPTGVAVRGNPQLVLLDLHLPKIDGVEILRRLRASERTRRLPVIILTTSDERRDIVECYDLGANSYVQKPVDFREFVEVVGRLARYWLTCNVASPV